MLASDRRKTGDGLIRDGLILLTGSSGAQFLSLMLIPVITRLFSVENYGVMAMFSTLSLTISVFACGGYDQAINLPKDDEKAWSLFCLCLILTLGFAFFLFILTIVFEMKITRWVFNSDKNLLVYMLPLIVLARGLYMPLLYWMIRFKSFPTLSSAAFVGMAGNQGTKVAGGYVYGDKIYLLLLGSLLYNVLPCILFCAKLLRTTPRHLMRLPDKSKLIGALREYRKFPLYSTWVELLINLSRGLLILLLSTFFDNKIVGYYGLAHNALRIPLGLITDAFRQICLPRFASLVNEKSLLSKYFLKITLILTMIASLPCVLVMTFGPQLFSFFFGSNWSEAGIYARIVAPWIFVLLVLPPASIVLTVTQRQDFRLAFYFILTAFQISVFILSALFGLDIRTILAVLSLGSFALYLGKILYGYRIVMQHDKHLLNED